MLWQDHNQDGSSQEGELKSIEDYGIAEIGLEVEQEGCTIEDSVLLSTGAAAREDGSILEFSEVALAVEHNGEDKVVEGENFEFEVSGGESSRSSEQAPVDDVPETVFLEPSSEGHFSVYGDRDDELFQTTEGA